MEAVDVCADLADLPPWLLTMSKPATNTGHRGANRGMIPKGEQHYDLVRIAGAMRHYGAGSEAIDAALQIVNEKQLEEPAPPEHMTKIAQSIERLYEPAPSFFALTDYGNAERLISGHGDDLRYCHSWGKWLVWDGKRWQVDATAEVERRAKQTVRLIYHEAAEATDEAVRKAIADWAKKSESRQRIDAMIDLAQSEPGVPVQPNELDADPWLLSCENATIGLRTGELREHRREDLITKLAGTTYEQNAEAERWQKHTEMFLPNANVRRQVQRDLGRALVGTTLDESLDIWYGGGANGKTTTARALIQVLGDYADRAAPDLLIASKNERHPTEVADLCGKRLIFSVEVDQGKHLAEALVKDLTGGDRKKARFMHQDFFSFEQTFSITLIVNHKPMITGVDEGIWRRIRLIPWQYRILEEQKRPQDEVLNELVAEGTAILNWLLEGLRDWQQDHGWTADEVKAAIEAYRAEMDVLGDFIAECCILGPRCTVPKAALYAAYEAWCEKTGEKAVSKRVFTERLRGRGIGEERTGHEGTRSYRGIGLLTVADRCSVNSHMRTVSEKQPEEVSASVSIDACAICGAEAYAFDADGKGYCERHLAESG